MKTFFKFSALVFFINLILCFAGAEGMAESILEQRRSKQQSMPGFVHIKGGSFTMGSPSKESGRGFNEVQHSISVNSFFMSQHVVTQKEWAEIMGAKANKEKYVSDHPVYSINWYDALEYCNKRSIKEGLTPVYDINKKRKDPNNKSTVDHDKWTVKWNKNANGYRLPTEAEWEYACRAGTDTAYNTGSDKISNDTGWYKDNNKNMVEPVGKKSANGWGLYDMHGNAWEWCWDWYGEYKKSDQRNPDGPVVGDYRVIRGGSWDSGARYLRSASRLYASPCNRYVFIGLRLVRP